MKKIFLLPFLLCLLLSGCLGGKSDGLNNQITSSQKGVYDIDDQTAVILDSVVDVFKEPNIRSERVTQVLYNEPVKIVEDIRDWSKVQLVEGSLGYIQTKYLSADCSSLLPEKINLRVIVSSKTKEVLSSAKNGITIKNIVLGTELFCISQQGSWYEVKLPENKKGWINNHGTFQVKATESVPFTSDIDFVLTLKKFIGSNYLTGGISSFGMDSSGLLYISGKINGISIARNLKDFYLSKEGETFSFENITVEDLKTGDILFFSDSTKSEITHAGILIGKGQFIEVSIDSGIVVISSLEGELLKQHIVGIKRIFTPVL